MKHIVNVILCTLAEVLRMDCTVCVTKTLEARLDLKCVVMWQAAAQPEKAVKAALYLSITPMKLPYTESKPCIFKCVVSSEHNNWDTNFTNYTLLSIHPTLGVWPCFCRSIGREEVILSRLRIGHTRLTHTYLLKGEAQPMCIPCQRPPYSSSCITWMYRLCPYPGKVLFSQNLFEGSMISFIFQYFEEIGLYNTI